MQSPAEEFHRSVTEFLREGHDLPVDTGHRWPPGRPSLPLETSMPGVFAAGDARHGSVKRVASAVGEGAATAPHQPPHPHQPPASR